MATPLKDDRGQTGKLRGAVRAQLQAHPNCKEVVRLALELSSEQLRWQLLRFIAFRKYLPPNIAQTTMVRFSD